MKHTFWCQSFHRNGPSGRRGVAAAARRRPPAALILPHRTFSLWCAPGAEGPGSPPAIATMSTQAASSLASDASGSSSRRPSWAIKMLYDGKSGCRMLRAVAGCHTRDAGRPALSRDSSIDAPPCTTLPLSPCAGDCPLCMREVEMLQRRDAGKGRICFVDVAAPDYDPAANAGISFEAAMERIHAIEADGTVLQGASPHGWLLCTCGGVCSSAAASRWHHPADWPPSMCVDTPLSSPSCTCPWSTPWCRCGGVSPAVRGGGPGLGVRRHQEPHRARPGQQAVRGVGQVPPAAHGAPGPGAGAAAAQELQAARGQRQQLTIVRCALGMCTLGCRCNDAAQDERQAEPPVLLQRRTAPSGLLGVSLTPWRPRLLVMAAPGPRAPLVRRGRYSREKRRPFSSTGEHLRLHMSPRYRRDVGKACRGQQELLRQAVARPDTRGEHVELKRTLSCSRMAQQRHQPYRGRPHNRPGGTLAAPSYLACSLRAADP